MKSRIKVPAAILVLTLVLPLAALADESSVPAAQAATPAKAAQAATPAKATPAAHSYAKMARIDLNAATKEELMKEPGVTEQVAEKIVAGRPYKSRGELVSKKIVTRAEYAKLRSHVMVKVEAAKSEK